MRYIRYITDLPFWVGLPIFLVGSLLTAFGLFWYIVGLIICFFGCWTFSKNLKENECASSGQAIICLPIMAICLWFINNHFIDPFIVCSFGTLFVFRTVSAMFFGFFGFQGFRK